MKKKEIVLEKVDCKTEWEFINCIADRCYSKFSEEDKEYIRENPNMSCESEIIDWRKCK